MKRGMHSLLCLVIMMGVTLCLTRGTWAAVAEPIDMQLNLTAGWNLVSLTHQPVDNSIQSFIGANGDKIISIWKYDATNNQWQVYLPGEASTGSYSAYNGGEVVREINAGDALWINTVAGLSLTIKANKVPFEAISYPANGWKMLGLKGTDQCNTVQELIPKNSHVDSVHVWKWQYNKWNVFLANVADGGQAYADSKGFDLLSEICPGEGFWMRTYAQKGYESWNPETMPYPSLWISPPNHFQGTSGDGTATLTWTPEVGDNVVGYKLSQNNGSELITQDVIGAGTSTFKFTNLKNGTKYEYKIQTYSKEQTSIFSDLVSVIPGGTQATTNTPPTITSLTTANDTVEEGTSVILNWTANDVDGSIVGYLYSLDNSTPSTPTTSVQKAITDLAVGQHTFYLKAQDNLGAYSQVASKTITVTKKVVPVNDFGQLILIVGGPTGPYDNLWPKLTPLADSLYNSFIRRGFTAEDIFFSRKADNTDEKIDDNSPTKDDLVDAITTWAGQSSKKGPLFIYMMNHGSSNGQFYLSTNEIISATVLKAAIDSFEQSTSRKVILVIDACYSGTFKEMIESPNIVVISSASKVKTATFSQDLSFTTLFTMGISQGFSIKQSFDISKQLLGQASVPFSLQDPQLGDLSSLANSLYVVGDFASAGEVFPVVENATVNNLTPKSGEVVKISADIAGNTDNLRRVWAIVTPPDFVPAEVTDFNVSDPNLPSITLGAGSNNHYEAFYNGFVVNGTHKVMVLALNGEGDIGISGSFDVVVNGTPGSTTTTTLASTTTTSTSTTPTTTTTTIQNGDIAPLTSGWNLVGLGFKNTQPFDVAKLGSVTSVWKWTTINGAKTWAVYLPAAEDKGTSYAVSKGFGHMTTIEPGEGFWVNMP